MILKQFYLNCLAHASYLIGDEEAGTAVVVDPQRDVERYLAFAAEHGLRIGHVVLTHFHADFVAGHVELRDRTGARIYLGAAARAEYPFTPLHDGDVVDLGRVRLQALETPGHTAESVDPTCVSRSAGRPRSSAACCTIRCATSCWRFRMPRRSIPRTAPDRSAGRR
jgi:hydroxyacylglutathione hydrolase